MNKLTRLLQYIFFFAIFILGIFIVKTQVYADACAGAGCGPGNYCGGDCGNTGSTGTLYNCSGTGGTVVWANACGATCNYNSSGPDYCNPQGYLDPSDCTSGLLGWS